jgi:predicted nucleic acid-binding protein
MDEIFVINSGPLITFARMDALHVVEQMPHSFLVPEEVKAELMSGPKDLLSGRLPTFIEVRALSSPHNPQLFDNLDSGEAAVIQLALENRLATVCLDERKARRVAAQHGLRSLGSLGLLGRAKTLGSITAIKPFVEKALDTGVHYDLKLIEDFLLRFGENWSDIG